VIKIVFLGTPDFALNSLKKLIENQEIQIEAVITQEDKPVGRKQIITAPPVKTLALEHNIKVFQPANINKDLELLNWLKEIKADFLVTVAYGQILRSEILSIAPVINLHASLLPDFRGPAPINWMIIHGEKTAGLTTMLSDAGIDTGDILLKASTALDDNDTAETLGQNLSELGADLLTKTLIEFSKIIPEKQKTSDSHVKQLAPFMDKNLGLIDFTKDHLQLKSANKKQTDFLVELELNASNIHNLARALKPWPQAYFMYDNKKIILEKTAFVEKETQNKKTEITKINKDDGSINMAFVDGELIIYLVKPEGKNTMKASDWLNGARLNIGSTLI